MSYKITYKKSVYKDLAKLEKIDAKKFISKIDKELKTNANQHPVLKGMFRGMRKFRVGNYRIVYSIINDDVLILRIAYRKDVYKIQ